MIKLIEKIKKIEEKNLKLHTICKNCSLNDINNFSNDIDKILCCNIDCSIYYQRIKSDLKMDQLDKKEKLIKQLLDF